MAKQKQTQRIQDQKQAVTFKKDHPAEYAAALSIWENQYSKKRSVIALRVGSKIETAMIKSFLELNDLSISALIRIILCKLGVLKNEHLAILLLKQFKTDFVIRIDEQFKKVDKLDVGGTSPISQHLAKKEIWQDIKDTEFTSLTASFDSFLMIPWAEWVAKQNESGTKILKREMAKIGVYPETYFESVIEKNSKNRTPRIPSSEMASKVIDDKKIVTKGFSVSGEKNLDLAKRLVAFKKFLQENGIAIADVVKHELMTNANYKDYFTAADTGFERGGRTENRFKAVGGKKVLQNQLPAALDLRNTASSINLSLNFTHKQSKHIDELIVGKMSFLEFFLKILEEGGWRIFIEQRT
jgi:hypothetical protein